MTILRGEVDSVVAELFRRRRRQWRGQGGGGNPHETWSDLQGMVSLAFLLDPDAVFTVALWASGQLSSTLSSLRTAIAMMDEAAGQLTGTLPTLGDTPDLTQASTALNQALATLGQGSVETAMPKVTEARTRVESFVRDSLVPVVAVNSTDRRTPNESREELRTQLEALRDRLGEAQEAADVLRDLLDTLDVVLPATAVRQIVRQVRADVDEVRTRFAGQTESERLSQARTDLIRLLADCTTLEQLGSFAVPSLVRTSVSCDAYGSGTGAPIAGTVSEPYELIDGVSDQLKLGFDGAAAVQYALVDSPNELHIDLPIAPLMGGVYTFSGFPPYQIWLLVDGREGNPVSIGDPMAGPWTPAAVAAAINATPGAIPENPPGSPMLVVAEQVTGGSSTVRIRYNVGGCVPANPGLGCYVEVRGATQIMGGAPPASYGFGWSGVDAGVPGLRTARTYWTPVAIRTLIDYLCRQVYGGNRIGDIAHLRVESSIVTSGNHGHIDPVLPTVFRVYNYRGTGEWYPGTGRVTLSGDDLIRIKKGDVAMLTGSAAVYQVAAKLADGVTLTRVSGTDPVTGTYTVTISPPLGTITTGMTLTYWDRGVMVYSRITGALYDVTGVLLIGMSRRSSLLPYPDVEGIPYTVLRSTLTMRSANDGPAGGTEVAAAAANDAAGVLGLLISSVDSQVDQLYGALADFETAGVSVGDYVYDGITLVGEVAEVLSSKVVRLDRQIMGTVAAVTMQFRHRQYQLYNDLTASFTALDTAPTIEALLPFIAECLRAPETGDAAAGLQAQLALLDAAAVSVQASISTFRTAFGSPSDIMTDCREALEESGADRSVNLLITGRLADLFSATTDDSTYSRRLLRSVRAMSRTMLGTSVFAPSIRQEVAALAPRDELELGIDMLPQIDLGPPGMTKR